MNNDMTDYQVCIINVLRYVTDFFERNNIRYFLAYGTMLGAVRHKGIIPWDDDADVFVLREDYERLLMMQEQLIDEGYNIISMESDGGYLTYAKIYNNNTSLWEVKQHPIMIGVFVDIFPLDYADVKYDQVVEQVKEFSTLSKNFSLANTKYTICDAWGFLKEGHLKTAWSVFQSFFLRKKKESYNQKMSDYYNSLHNAKGKYLVDYSSSVNVEDPRSVIYEGSWFDDYIMMDFCDFKARVPIGYDEYLTCRYGDYMKYPPKSERLPQHSHYYLSLHRHVSIEEAKISIK